MGDAEKAYLCKLKKRGFIETNTREYIQLIQHPQFFCKKCGRGAIASVNLCTPEKMEQ